PHPACLRSRAGGGGLGPLGRAALPRLPHHPERPLAHLRSRMTGTAFPPAPGMPRMRAIVYRENGPADVLRLVERTIPEPGHGEVRVRVHVSGVNPTDWKSRAGT